MPIHLNDSSRKLVLLGLAVAMLIGVVVGMIMGPAKVDLGSIGNVFASKVGLSNDTPDPVADAIVWHIRLPRLISAILAGAGLALSGAMLQGLFRNPLADPALIGVSGGAAMGAVVAFVVLPQIGMTGPLIDWFGLPVLAMCGSVGLTFLIYRISLVGGKTHVASMLLTGIAINAISGALIGLAVTIFASDDQLRSFTFWSLGSIAGANWTSVWVIAAIVVPSLFFAIRYAKALNAFLLGEVEAYHLGIEVQQVKRAAIFLSAIMVGVTVAFFGIIGFVGLVIPHIIRISFGPDHRLLLPAGALAGGLALIIADTFARTVIAPAELQIGILTSILGGPFFLGLLISGRRKMAL
ncbi:iron ABC transporter permease [Rubellicoccus peritrichatus]|uniref:Iron ABC transporter permease n=1 Tax=Rubellicoccus peritrichatus TaxID=3080537 RepID=A0AAQ3LEU8_9BACT|nr:iron ABC transporter permease [Puniceicoccus sp. CR14]WOO42640.1 iron ABC transporter permease [Puniceicoccus sp. CR14]